MKDEVQVSEELLEKVYKKRRELLRILISMCIQKYIYILQIIAFFVHKRKCVGPAQDYDEVVYYNESGYYITQFHSTLVGMHVLH
jgi:hypothetical protein